MKKPAATGSRTQHTPGLSCHCSATELQPLSYGHWATATGQPQTLTILYVYSIGGTECLTWQPLSLSHQKGQPLTNFWLSGCQVWDWGIQYYLHIEDCESWSLPGCRSSVAEHWRLKPGVSWVRLQTTASLLTFLCLRLITSKFLFPAWDKILWAFTISCVMMTIMVLCTDDSTSFQLDRHMRRLDQDLNRFTIELEADTAGITEILEQSEKAYLLFL